MQRLALCTLSLSFALTSAAPAADTNESNTKRPTHAAPARATARPAPNPAQLQRPAFPAQGVRNFQGVPRPQSFRASPEGWPGRTGLNSDGSVQPRTGARGFAPHIALTETQPARVFAPRPPASNPSASPAATATPPAGKSDSNAGPRGNWSGQPRRGGNTGWRNHNNSGENQDSQTRGGGNGEERGKHSHHRHDRDSHSNHWRHWDRNCHDRDWWRSHYNRFTFFGGGCYYWNAGYWYPAYGYNPYFTTYTYDAPIYAYNDLDPGDVVANVQEELQRLGYYEDEIDGDYGPTTRQALLDYQRDNGLPVTGEIDEETLGSLGFE